MRLLLAALCSLPGHLLTEGRDCEPGEQGQDCECQEGQLQSVQHLFHNCVAQHTLNFEDTKNGSVDAEESGLCNLLEVSTGECAQVLQACHQEDEIQRMMDMQLETMMAQYHQYQVESCVTVNEFIKSGRRDSNVSPGQLCSNSQTILLRQKFQDCTNSITTKAYEDIQGIEDEEKVVEKLCSALLAISSCVAELEQCFTPEDSKTIAEGNHQQMKQYLANFGNLEESALDECDKDKNQGSKSSTAEEEDIIADEIYHKEEYQKKVETPSSEERNSSKAMVEELPLNNHKNKNSAASTLKITTAPRSNVPSGAKSMNQFSLMFSICSLLLCNIVFFNVNHLNI